MLTQRFKTAFDNSSPASQNAVLPLFDWRAENPSQQPLRRMIERSASIVMPAVFFPKGMKDFNGIVGAELLRHKTKVRSGQCVRKQVVKSAANPIGGTELRFR